MQWHDSVPWFYETRSTSNLPDNRREDSGPMFFVCRSLFYDRDDMDETLPDFNVYLIHVRIAGNRALLERWRPGEKEIICFYPVCGLAAYHRMFHGVHDVCRLPPRILKTMMGREIPQPKGKEGLGKYKRREEVMGDTDVAHLLGRVHKGSLTYLDSLPEEKCNSSQKRALVTSLHEIGSICDGGSSFSAIVGPPGKGKTTSIALLTGALLHHSAAGHVGRKQLNILKL